jgi:hypothetical protein
VLLQLKSDWESNTKRYRTSPAFQCVFSCPHPINGLGDTTFCRMTELLKTAILDRLQG